MNFDMEESEGMNWKKFTKLIFSDPKIITQIKQQFINPPSKIDQFKNNFEEALHK